MTQKQNNNEQKIFFKHFVGGGEAEMKMYFRVIILACIVKLNVYNYNVSVLGYECVKIE